MDDLSVVGNRCFEADRPCDWFVVGIGCFLCPTSGPFTGTGWWQLACKGGQFVIFQDIDVIPSGVLTGLNPGSTV